MHFKPGQKVVCVNAGKSLGLLSKGSVYTVQSVSMWYGDLGVTLVEVGHPNPYEGFYAHRFRHAVEKKTDIAVFTKMLKRERKKISV